MPTKGLSLHLGLNRVDPAHYGGWDGALTACEFTGTHKQFRNNISALMPASQTPNYYKVGAANPAFEAQKPFTI